MEFTKMSGAGNDFIVVDNRFYSFTHEELSGFATQFCRRREGIGADGLLALSNPASDSADYKMTYYNADGSLGTMCGNGARCLAKFARNAGLESEPLVFDSDAGIYSASVEPDSDDVRLFVPAPQRYVESIELETNLPEGASKPHFIWTGTEHIVIFVDDVEHINVLRIGRMIRKDPALAPAGSNVNFVEIEGEVEGAQSLKVRTFEKGVEDETLACGTGALAASLVSALTGKSDATRYAVRMKGGTLFVGWRGASSAPKDLYLEGAAEVIFRGTLEL